MEKTYVIKIEAEGLKHYQAIDSKDDLDILIAVLEKIKADATKTVTSNPL